MDNKGKRFFFKFFAFILIMKPNGIFLIHTVCPGGSVPFYIVSYYIKWVTTSWTYSTRRKIKIGEVACISFNPVHLV